MGKQLSKQEHSTNKSTNHLHSIKQASTHALNQASKHARTQSINQSSKHTSKHSINQSRNHLVPFAL